MYKWLLVVASMMAALGTSAVNAQTLYELTSRIAFPGSAEKNVINTVLAESIPAQLIRRDSASGVGIKTKIEILGQDEAGNVLAAINVALAGDGEKWKEHLNIKASFKPGVEATVSSISAKNNFDVQFTATIAPVSEEEVTRRLGYPVRIPEPCAEISSVFDTSIFLAQRAGCCTIDMGTYFITCCGAITCCEGTNCCSP